MRIIRAAAMATILAAGTAFAAGAQPFPYSGSGQPYYQALPPAPPPSAFYNPYTSGLGPCPQRWPGDPPCSEMISPSYGQPDYWPRSR